MKITLVMVNIFVTYHTKLHVHITVGFKKNSSLLVDSLTVLFCQHMLCFKNVQISLICNSEQL